MCCGNTCTKYLMFIFNFIFALGGIALLVVGALTQARISKVTDFLDGKFSAPPIVLIVLGSIIFVIAFFGCCGAIRDSACMLTTFAILLILILLAGIAIAVVAFVFMGQISDLLTNDLLSSVQAYYTDNAAKERMDAIQSNFQCCGATSYTDYNSVTLPDSCCDGNTGTCSRTTLIGLYRAGCRVKLEEFVKFSGALLGGIALGVALIMIIGVVLSLGLVRTIKRTGTV